MRPSLLDFSFFEDDVLLNLWVIFAQVELLPTTFLRSGIEIASACG